MSIAISTKVWDLAFPNIVFAIGEGVEQYEKLKKLRSNIFWCVIVAGIIGLILNLLL